MMKRLLCVVLAFSTPAWALEDCFAADKRINLSDGSSTAGYTGMVRCFDRDTKDETRSMSFLNGKQTGREKRRFQGGEAMEQEYREGKRHGEYRKYLNGKLLEVSHYVDDRELGEALRYSKSGKLIRKVDRREPDALSTWQDFDEEGRLADAGCGLQRSVRAGTAGCPWKGPSPLVLFHPDGQKRAVIALRDGLREGLTTTFTRDGQQDSEEHFARGLREGPYTEFANGKVRRTSTFTAGEKTGAETDFFPEGGKRKVTVLQDHKVARFTEYFQNGALKFEQVNDGPQSVESEFDDEGRLQVRTHFLKGLEEGLRERFLPDGGVSQREAYTHGRLSTRQRWDPDGGLIEDAAFYEDGSRKKPPL